MTYKEQLSPWCIIRHLPKMQRIVVARFRRRNDAEDHLRLLQQMMPDVEYKVIYEPLVDKADAIAQSYSQT